MKSFKTYQNLLPLLISYDILTPYGLIAPNKIQKYLYHCYITINNLLIFGGLLCIIASLAYEANTLQDYTDNITILAAIVNDALILISLGWRFKQAICLIQNCEDIIEKSEQISCTKT